MQEDLLSDPLALMQANSFASVFLGSPEHDGGSPFHVNSTCNTIAKERTRRSSCTEISLTASDASNCSLDITTPSEFDGRAMSPISGFKLRPSRSESELSEGNLSGVPTVVQSERRILAPKARHSSPLQPMRLFMSCDSKTQSSTGLFSLEIQNSRKMQSSTMNRHVRHHRRDLPDIMSFHPDPRDNISNPEVSSRPPIAPNTLWRRPSQDLHSCRGNSHIQSFHHDFFDFVQIGRGSFGNVYRCTRKIDLRTYAVKEITNEFRSERERERALKEIYAMSTQRENIHVVRYHNAWEENGKLYIQTELCSETLSHLRKAHEGPLPEALLRDVLGQIASGLAYMHDKWNMVHLDIKPENMYTTESGIYKLGDFGLASLADRRELAEEGDKRYLSREMLQRADCDLLKVDIFALGVSIYELASEHPLPTEGDDYHALRDGSARPLPNVSQDLQAIVWTMMQTDPAGRPAAKELARHPLLQPTSWPCLDDCPSDPILVNVIPALVDSARLEWMLGQAQRLEKDAEIIAASLAYVTAEVRRLEEFLRPSQA